jgi:hypothetical protein
LRLRRHYLAIFAGLLIVAVTSAVGGIALQVVERLAFGWIRYVARVAPRISVSWIGLVTAIACLVALGIGLHLFLRWLVAAAGSARGWSARWTSSLLALVVLMFAAGIGMVGIGHQSGWLFAARDWFLEQTVEMSRGSSVQRQQEIALAFVNYGQIDPETRGATVPTKGWPNHGWQTAILPYLGYLIAGVDYDLPWRHPRNSAQFKGVVLEYLNPDLALVRSPDGFALSHYSGNVNLLGRGQVPALSGVQSASATILAGEVTEGFKPWGDPTNLRDPARGLNLGEKSFGNPASTGATFVLMDGSVRFLRNTTDPKILRALSVPRLAGEPAGR